MKVFDLSPYIEFELRRGEEDSAPVEVLEFTATVVEIKGDSVTFMLEFENPNKVSIGSNPDIIIMIIISTDFF